MARIFLLSSMLVVTSSHIMVGSVITFFLREYPFYTISEKKSLTSHDVGYLDTKIHTTVRYLPNMISLSGIFATYAGYLDASNYNGAFEFPRKTIKPQFFFLITDRIKPILLAHNTVHHWELEPDVPAVMYSIEQKYDEDSKTHYWLTKSQQLPENNFIPIETIILLVRPVYVYVAEGITISDANVNLTLPDIYIKRGIDEALNALYILNFKNFLSPVITEYKKNDVRYATHIVE